MQGTQARPLVWEIPHAVEQHAIELGLCAATMCVPICSGTLELQLLRPVRVPRACASQQEKPPQ